MSQNLITNITKIVIYFLSYPKYCQTCIFNVAHLQKSKKMKVNKY